MQYIPFYRPNIIYGLESLNQKRENIAQESVDLLIKNFLKKLNYPYAVAVSNISLAIHLSLCAIQIKRGDKIICPINSSIATPHSIRYFDSEPIFVDINLQNYHINPEALHNAIKQNKSKKLRAIIVKHFAGLHQDITPLLKIAKEHNLLVIEDFSEYTLFKNIQLQSDIAIFSLNFPLDKFLQGALVVFKDESTYKKAKILSNNAIVPSNELKYLYDIVDVGCEYQIDALKAHLLNNLIPKREKFVKKRIEIANHYINELSNTPHIKLPLKSTKHQYTFFIIEIDKNRDSFAKELNSLGIEVGLHSIPFNFTTYYKQKYNLKIFSFPNALNIYQKILSLPCHSKLQESEIEYIIKSVKKVAKAHV